MSDRICTHEDCGEPARSRGFCSKHYYQRKRAGAFAPRTLIERFEEKIREGPNGCWEWTGALIPSGYGMKWNGERVVPAHRWSYEYHRDEIPDGLQLDHLCRNRRCVNPWHLEPVTNRVNSKRGKAAGVNRERNLARTHCPYGHEFTPENTYASPARGDRQCLKCSRARTKVAQAIQQGREPIPTW